MPAQRSILGPRMLRISPRRLPMLLGTIALLAVAILVFALPNGIPAGPSLSKFADEHIPIQKISDKLPSAGSLNPFRPSAHAPPVQKNSTSGEASWYSNWNWLRPFSSSVTLDENRSLLPPLPDRPAIYTYYDNTLQKDKVLKDAEHDLLLTWRRAWWAKGFKPIILGPAEAMNNPLYEEVQQLKLQGSVQTEVNRWLAWETMGTGMLCNYLTLPMSNYDDDLFAFLRRGEYPKLTRFEGLGNGLYVGEKKDITKAVKAAIGNPDLPNVVDIVSAVPASTFSVDPNHDGVAFYDAKTIQTKYTKLTESFMESDALLYVRLNQMINAHLLNTFQNLFSDGIAVLKPMKKHATALLEPALELAKTLAQCPENPMPASCPPNRPKCRPCVSSQPMKITSPQRFRNASTLFTIGMVPHPYTMALLDAQNDNIGIPYIRRESPRDAWVSVITKDICGTAVGSAPRVLKFKEAVAAESGKSHSLWLIAEKQTPTYLDWYFGFTIPKTMLGSGRSETPVPGPERRPKPPTPKLDSLDHDAPPSEQELVLERALLDKATAFLKKTDANSRRLLDAMEAWNLADIEAWRFTRAYRERAHQDRQRWENEEKRYAGGAGSAAKTPSRRWSSWFDAVADEAE